MYNNIKKAFSINGQFAIHTFNQEKVLLIINTFSDLLIYGRKELCHLRRNFHLGKEKAETILLG
jgi:hypothetical protein